MQNLKELSSKRWKLLSFENGVSSFEGHYSHFEGEQLISKANVQVLATPSEIYLSILESKFFPFNKREIYEYSQSNQKLNLNRAVITARLNCDVKRIFQKNSSPRFQRTTSLREDGSYLISFRFNQNDANDIFVGGITGFHLLYLIMPTLIYQNGRMNLISIVTCYSIIDGLSLKTYHRVLDLKKLPATFLKELSSHLENFENQLGESCSRYLEHHVSIKTKLSINKNAAKGSLLERFWSVPVASDFSIRGCNYLQDRKKIPAKEPFGELVAVDWLFDDQKIVDVCSSSTGTFKSSLEKCSDGTSIIFAINLQVPAGPRHFSLIFYYKIEAAFLKAPIFNKFLSGNEKYRNSRLKLIPNVSTGPWIVQSSVGRKPLIIGGALRVDYHQSSSYFEADVDIGSSAIASSIVRFVLGCNIWQFVYWLIFLCSYVRLLVVDLCFLIEAQLEEELPVRIFYKEKIL